MKNVSYETFYYFFVVILYLVRMAENSIDAILLFYYLLGYCYRV